MYIPQSFHMQWHITERCNLRCTHCYQNTYTGKELTFKQLLGVLDQYKEALATYRKLSNKKIPAHITLTGGEPFVRKDIFKLLAQFKKDRDLYDFSILTNGTLIDKKLAIKLKEYNPKYVQVSIEGCEETHDSIRGKGMYKKAKEGLNYLVNNGFYTVVSFTVHKKNYLEFPSVAKLGRELGVSRVWSDRLIPSGSGKLMQDLMLTPEETRSFFQIMKEEQLKRSEDYYPKTEIAMHRALQFLCGGTNYSCYAGKTLITINSNGDVYPCRRMPIKIGNLLKDNLLKIFSEDPLLKRLRDEESSCSSCLYYKRCKGGLRCLSYALTKDPLKKDPGCWIKHGE